MMMASPTAASAAATIITKKTKIWPFTCVPLVREGDKGKIHGIEHQLNRHEDGDQVALDQKSDDAKAKQHGAQKQIPGERDFLCERGALCVITCSVVPCVSVAVAGQSNGAQNGDENQNRRDFKRQQQFVKQDAAQIFSAGDVIAQ